MPARIAQRIRATRRRGAPKKARVLLRKALWLLILALLLANTGAAQLLNHPPAPPRVTVPFSPYFLDQVNAGEVRSITAAGNTIHATFKTKVRYPAVKRHATATTLFATEVPSFWSGGELAKLLQRKDVEILAPQPTSSSLLLADDGLGLVLVISLALALITRRLAFGGEGVGGILGAFGHSKARRVDPEQITVSFADVAGIDEAKHELSEIADFLRNPERYRRLGGRMPHGVLLSGAPGTGKTLLARAVAGEAQAAFFSIAASEFIEQFVGVGAARVRDLFAKAREHAPAIIFIDELDAIGRSRQGQLSYAGGHEEREQTLDQILTELDGFEPTDALVVLAATNRPEILDPALLRAGRFDRRVAVQAPDRAGRTAILEVHTRALTLAAGVALDAIAASTPGMVGADLANLANEAALLGARSGHESVQSDDFAQSLEKIVLGAPRAIVLSAADRERIAYHEAGHALVGMLTPNADPVRKVSIIPRANTLGVTLATPDRDPVNHSHEDLKAKLRVMLAGRVAEQIVYGSASTGAERDIEQVTLLARKMVGRWGMSDAIGPVAVLPADDDSAPATALAPETAILIDRAVRQLIEQEQEAVRELLVKHHCGLESVARLLLERETLDASELHQAAAPATEPVHVAV